MTSDTAEWTRKGASLSDKTARKEYGLTQEEIIEWLRDGKLEYRVNYVYDNPYYKLLRREVEAMVVEKYGKARLDKNKNETELAGVNTELRKLKKRMKELEKRKAELTAALAQASG